jgi:GAF domain
VEVCADNWLSALRAGREQTGDPGGVPPGASCVMSESGEVTILDPARRIRYLISPASVAAQQPEPPRPPPPRPSARGSRPQGGVSAPTVEPPAPPTPVAQLDAAPAPEEPGSAGAPEAPDHAAKPDEPPLAQPVSEVIEQAPAAVRGATRLTDAASSHVRGPDTDASADRPNGDTKQSDASTGRAQQTLAYNAQRADALKREYETARALVTPAEGEAEAESERGSRPNLRALPPVQRGIASASAIPPPPKLDRLLGARARPSRPSGLNPTAPRLVPAFTRDVDPTPQSPITYRERAYVLAPADQLVNLEGLMQAELIKLRGELAQAPRGQLIHLAAFIKPFQGTPSEPPVATLEWSDWRSNAVFVSNAAEAPRDAMRPGSTSRPPSVPAEAPAHGEIPAPGSHVALIPRPPTPLASPLPASASATVPEWANTAAEPPAAHVVEPTPVEPPPVAESKPVEPATWTSLAAQLEVPPPAGPAPAAAKPLWSTLASKLDPAQAPAVASHATASTPPPAFTPPSDTAAFTQAASQAPVIAPALPWMSAPVQPAVDTSAPAVQREGVQVPPAFRTAQPITGSREERDDTGEVDSRLASAFEALPDLYFLPTPVAGLEFTTQLVSRLVPCEAISVCLYDINTDEFRFVAVGGPGANQRRASAVPSSAGLFGAAKRSTGDALVIKKVEHDPRYQQAVDGREDLEALDLAYVPLRHRQQLLGMVQLINRAGDRGFTSADVAVLHYIANQLAEFLASRRAG